MVSEEVVGKERKGRNESMARKMLINAATEDEIRVAIVEGGILQEVGIDKYKRTDSRQHLQGRREETGS